MTLAEINERIAALKAAMVNTKSHWPARELREFLLLVRRREELRRRGEWS